MKNPLYDDDQEGEQGSEIQHMIEEMMIEEQRDNMQFEFVPKNMDFPSGFPHFNQLIFPQRLKLDRNIDENINQQNNANDGKN